LLNATDNALDRISKILKSLENDIAAPLESRLAALEKLKEEVWKAWWKCCIKDKESWDTTTEDPVSKGGTTEDERPCERRLPPGWLMSKTYYRLLFQFTGSEAHCFDLLLDCASGIIEEVEVLMAADKALQSSQYRFHRPVVQLRGLTARVFDASNELLGLAMWHNTSDILDPPNDDVVAEAMSELGEALDAYRLMLHALRLLLSTRKKESGI